MHHLDKKHLQNMMNIHGRMTDLDVFTYLILGINLILNAILLINPNTLEE